MSLAAFAFRAVAPAASPNYAASIDGGDERLRIAGVDTPLRVAHFLGQVLHETGGGRILRESLRYRTKARLLEIFGPGHSAGIREDEADAYLGDGEKLAERVYGLGNPVMARRLGNQQPGDGYKYRGGGMLQATGADTYRRLGRSIGVDLLEDPDRICLPDRALAAALAYWTAARLNDAADRDDVVAVTKGINGGTIGLSERIAWVDKVRAAIAALPSS